MGYRNVHEFRNEDEDRSIDQFIEHQVLRKSCRKHGANYFEITSNYELEMERLNRIIGQMLLEYFENDVT